jgi:anti-sigma B factor antagonist
MTEGLTTKSSSRPTDLRLRVALPGPYGMVHRGQDRTVVELHGEIDIAASALIGAYLDVVTAVRDHEVLVDLTHVAFFDCSGVTLLCRALRRTAANGGRMSVICDRPAILRVFRASGALAAFRVLPTLDAALAAQN